MQKSGITLHKKGNGVGALHARLEMLAKSDVLVGIPQAKNSRRGHGAGNRIGNAELLYIHTNGSPIRGIPARPVIEPAIQASGNKEPIQLELKLAAIAIMSHGDPAEAFQHLSKAGMIGVNAARQWFFDPRNNWAPNAPSTIRRKGSSQPLIDTGSLRAAITYVVRTVR